MVMSHEEPTEFGCRQQRFAYASSHAAKRIGQRTSMNIQRLMDLLDADVCVNIGQHAGSHRRHMLFFSPEDHFYYVAIQDSRNGKVITVLPPAYHKNLAWRITPEQCLLAKKNYEDYTKSHAVAADAKVIAKQMPLSDKKRAAPIKYRTVTITKRTSKIIVQALYINELLKSQRKTLFKTTIDFYLDDFEKNIMALLKKPHIHEQIDTSIQQKRLFQQSVYALCFQNKKDSTTYYILKIRSEYEAEDQAYHHKNQRQHMRRVLSRYASGYILLAAPHSMTLPRLMWQPLLSHSPTYLTNVALK